MWYILADNRWYGPFRAPSEAHYYAGKRKLLIYEVRDDYPGDLRRFG